MKFLINSLWKHFLVEKQFSCTPTTESEKGIDFNINSRKYLHIICEYGLN